MEQKIIADIIITLIIISLMSLSFMGFIVNFNKKKYFISGSYLSGLIAFSTILILFILRTK